MPDDLSEVPELHVAGADPPQYPVQAAYTPPGPYATTTSTVTDGAGNAIYDLFYPADYAALGFKSPIVTWGNGTDSTPPQRDRRQCLLWQPRRQPHRRGRPLPGGGRR